MNGKRSDEKVSMKATNKKKREEEETHRETMKAHIFIEKSKLKNHTLILNGIGGATVFISIIINTSLTKAIVLKSYGLILPLIRYKNNYDPLIS